LVQASDKLIDHSVTGGEQQGQLHTECPAAGQDTFLCCHGNRECGRWEPKRRSEMDGHLAPTEHLQGGTSRIQGDFKWGVSVAVGANDPVQHPCATFETQIEFVFPGTCLSQEIRPIPVKRHAGISCPGGYAGPIASSQPEKGWQTVAGDRPTRGLGNYDRVHRFYPCKVTNRDPVATQPVGDQRWLRHVQADRWSDVACDSNTVRDIPALLRDQPYLLVLDHAPFPSLASNLRASNKEEGQCHVGRGVRKELAQSVITQGIA